jgi:PAS domain S-box-containing protein
MTTNDHTSDVFVQKIGTWEYNIEKSLFTVSNNFLEIINYTNEEKINLNRFFAILTLKEKKLARTSLEDAILDKKPFSIELQLNTTHNYAINWNGSVCEIKKGKNLRISGILEQRPIPENNDHKNTIHILQKKNEFISTILQNLPIGIAVNDTTTGEASTVNELFCKTYGWDEEDLIDIPNFFTKVYPNENYRNQIMSQVLSDIKSGDPNRMNWKEIEVVTKSGEKRIINAKNIPVPNQNLMISTVVDVTTEYLQHAEIKRIKKNQESLINSSTDFIWQIDTNFNIVIINESLKNYLKKSLNKDLQEGDSILYPELGIANYKKWKDLYNKALNGNKFSIRDENFNPISQKIEYRNITFNPVFDSNGNLFGASCYSKNNDKDVKYLFQLEKTQKELKKILDHSLDVICTFNREGIFTQVNKAAKTSWGYTPAELINTSYTKYFFQKDFDRISTILSDIRKGVETTSFVSTFICKDQSFSEMEWSIRWDTKEELMFCIARDCTKKIYNEKMEKVELKVYEEFSNPNNSIATTLTHFIKGIESIHPDMIVAFFELKEYHLHGLCKNRLPNKFSNVIEGVPISLNATPCSTAAYTKKEVIVSDIANDIRWKEYKDIALKNNLKACWTIPILNTKEEVIATFGLYFNTIKSPTLLEQKMIQKFTKLFRILLENEYQKKQLLLSNQRYEYVTKVTFDAIWDWDIIREKVYWGQNYLSIFGDIKDHLGLNDLEKINQRLHVDELDAINLKITSAIRSNENFWSFEHQYLKSDNTYAHVINKALIIRDKNGRALRVIGSMQDVSKQKEELRRLKLMESVITHTNDSVLITEAEPFDEPGPKIIFVNEAFTKLTGYTFEEVVGKTPRILQGPKSNFKELNKLSKAIKNWQPYQITTINYKKTGEEFWINFTVNPVANEKGLYTHWIAIAKDVTASKTKELQKSLMSELSVIFNQKNKISEALEISVEKITKNIFFDLGEVWLLNSYQETVSLQATFSESIDKNIFYNFEKFIEFNKNEGLIWTCLESKEIQFSNSVTDKSIYGRKEAARKIGLQTVYAIPIIVNSEAIGVIILGSLQTLKSFEGYANTFGNLGQFIGKEIKRKQLENELSYMFEAAPDILCLINLDGQFKKVNPSASLLLEYDEATLLNSFYKDLLLNDDLEYTTNELAQLSSNKPIVYFENRYITKSNKIIWLAWTVTKDSEQNLLFGMAKDITQKKELEQLLDSANTLAKIGGWELDLKQNKLFWSKITREIHEVGPDYVPDVANSIQTYKKGINRNIISKSVKKIICDGDAFDHELQIVTPKGQEKWVRVIGESEFFQGKCVRVYGSFQDINDRKQAEVALRKAYEEKNTILESIGDAFFRVDKNWNVTYWNNKAAIILQKPKNRIINKNLWEEFADAFDSLSYNNYHKALSENSSQHFETFYSSLNIWFEVSAYPYDSGLSVYFRDITYRKATEIKLLELNLNLTQRSKQLELSNLELEQFAYIASHDLQEPLRMITSFLTQIEKKYETILDERGKQYIFFAVDGAKRMRQIILDLLEFSRVGKQIEVNQDVDINDIIKEITQMFTKEITLLDVKIIISNQLPIILTQRSAIMQVFQNIISNGVKYIEKEKKPVIKINYENLKNSHKFTICDNGIGIDPQYFDKIFIMFQRLHHREKYPGTGIGLAITKKIVENLGGSISVHSSLGKGSTFSFIVPKNSKK